MRQYPQGRYMKLRQSHTVDSTTLQLGPLKLMLIKEMIHPCPGRGKVGKVFKHWAPTGAPRQV